MRVKTLYPERTFGLYALSLTRVGRECAAGTARGAVVDPIGSPTTTILGAPLRPVQTTELPIASSGTTTREEAAAVARPDNRERLDLHVMSRWRPQIRGERGPCTSRCRPSADKQNDHCERPLQQTMGVA